MATEPAPVPDFTDRQVFELRRAGVDPATVEWRWMKAVPKPEWSRAESYLVADRKTTYYAVPVVAKGPASFMIILPDGHHFRVPFPASDLPASGF
jgi:hypothetical protein